MFEGVLVPVDGSPHANRAVEVAIELAKCHGSVIHLLHAIRDLSLPKEILDMIQAGEITAGRLQILQDSAEIILNNALERCKQAGLSNIHKKVVMGDPATKMLEYAEQNGIDLIVIGQQGLQPNPGLLGGVVRKLVNMTPISCLIVT